ncbi:MAG: two-component sensor histidine kinase [Firmicutes bacterium HGW-Firmicutes-16]|nr:MAG: two-component sensor histidine kinase [Firmicutes bacterium HGW-Firmicutes-16]
MKNTTNTAEPKKKPDKVSSTTTRLQDLQIRRIKTALFFSGLFTLILLVAGFCYINDSAYAGTYNPFTLWGDVTRHIQFETSKIFFLPSVKYVIHIVSKVPETIDATAYFYLAIVGLIFISLLNGIIMFIARPISKAQISKQLQPLYNMAQTALKLSSEPDPISMRKGPPPGADSYDERQIHNLESAIDSFKGDVPDAELRTGDKDLQGLEDAINSLIKRTRESYSQQIRFVSDASHELRTPIAVVKGYTDMLDRWGKKDEKILDESIAAIKTETDNMNKLVEQLLFLARGDSGKTKLTYERFSLSDMIREVYEESLMIDQNHKWDISARDEVTAYGDTAMLKQATRILVDNAAKYTPEGETISLKAIIDKSGAPTIIVQDNGIGIAGQDMSHIFDRFYRSDPARNRQQGGTGLGLSIAKWIVDRHSGYFEVVSREDIGTRISIHLPLVKTEQMLA